MFSRYYIPNEATTEFLLKRKNDEELDDSLEYNALRDFNMEIKNEKSLFLKVETSENGVKGVYYNEIKDKAIFERSRTVKKFKAGLNIPDKIILDKRELTEEEIEKRDKVRMSIDPWGKSD